MKGLITRCSACDCATELREIVVEFERRGIHATMRGIPAMVCPQCGEEYVPGSLAGDVIQTVSTTIDATAPLLKRANQQRRELAADNGAWTPECLELALAG